jgi:hypothetical protein
MDSVVHFEIPFEDKQRAMKFYTESFGWQLTDMPQMSYVVASTTEVDDKQMPKKPGAINGGLFQRPKDAPHPAIYISGMGAYARVADTEGNIVGLFQSHE